MNQMCWKKVEGAPVKEVNGRMEIDADHIGGSLPSHVWFASEGKMAATWNMRWSVQGLAPSRPHITYCGDNCEIPSGRALPLQ
jgi:hypothetical protein